jgi:signal transduction histidine kinase
MMSVFGNVLTLLVLFAGMIAAGLAIAAWWNREQPGIYWFSIHVGLVALWAFVAFGSFVAESTTTTRVLGLAANGISLSVTLSWFLFIITYLGYREGLNRWLGWGFVFGLGGFHFALQSTAAQTDILVTEITVRRWNTYQVLETEPSIFGTVILVAVLSIFLLGIGLIINALFTDRLGSMQAGILLVATLTPLTGAMLQGFLLVPGGVPLIQQASALSVTLYAVAFNRYDMFTFTPATERIGVDRAFEELDAGVLVAKNDGQVIRANQPGCGILGVSRAELLGRDVADVLAEFDLTADTLPAVIECENRYYRVTDSDVTDSDGTTLGCSVLFLDVTDQRLREQRLDVLNRVLRHNLRNDLQVLKMSTEMLADNLNGENETFAQQALERVKSVDSTSTKARTVGRLIEDTQRSTAMDLSGTLAGIVDSYRADFAAVSFTLDTPAECVVEVSRSLELALENLVENAAQHNDASEPHVDVTLTDEGPTVTVTVSDNGSGIAQHELAVIESGEETELEHGSGMGLWAIQWAIDSTDAEISYETGPSGTTATLRIQR